MIDSLKKERYDYFLIWGNGLKYKEEIIEIIRKNPYVEILAIKRYTPKNIAKLVKGVYSYDYAPFKHLRNKTKYLLSVEPSVTFVFVLNTNPQEVYTGSPLFEHIECMLIKSIKEEIRNEFNERKDDRRTEDHVVHTSDNQSQTDYILKYLGYKEGIGLFKNIPNSLLSSVPYHISKFNKFTLKYVSSAQVYCSISTGPKSHKLCKIEETPHFAFLTGNTKPYEEYRSMCESFSCMTDDQFPYNFRKFAQDFACLKEPYSTSYILTREFRPRSYQVLDGVHRVSILRYQEIDEFIVAVVR